MTKTMIITIWAVLTALVMQAQSPGSFDLTGRSRKQVMAIADAFGGQLDLDLTDEESLVFRVENVGSFYAGFDDGICFQSLYNPSTASKMRYLITGLNKDAVSTGDDAWKLYFEEGYVTEVKLSYYRKQTGDGFWLFTFQMVKTPLDD